MRYPIINLKTTGSLTAHNDVIRTFDNLGIDPALFAWAGCIDAGHVIPAGSCRGNAHAWDKDTASYRQIPVPTNTQRG